jgi:polyisoprenoid-binding protein YceI
MTRLLPACVLLALAATLPPGPAARDAAAASAAIAPVATEVPAGTYGLDRAHASLTFRVNHLGLSRYTARFIRFDARLELDPAQPARSSVTATIDPRSLRTDFPDPGYDFDADLQGADWLDAARFPQIAFRSTRVELTGPNTARITGEVGMHGVTRPVVLEATFNGGYARHPMDPSGSRIGFSAHGALKRSEFGIAAGVPEPGSTMGVGDEVEFLIEAEFTRPAADSAAPSR